MSNNKDKNECLIFPVQQIISTSIGAMSTALLMVEYYLRSSVVFQSIVSSLDTI